MRGKSFIFTQLAEFSLILLIFYWLPIRIPAKIAISFILLIATFMIIQKCIINRTENLSHRNTNKISQELNVVSSRIFSICEEIYLSINESNLFSQQLFSQTETMKNLNQETVIQINKTISGIKNLLDYSCETRDAVDEMETSGRASGDIITNSLSNIGGTVEAINEIKNTSSHVSGSIGTLRGTLNEIQGIIRETNNISREMNLISINATVEAARAGQSGKGFAVVVQELQRLTVSTDKALKDIDRLMSTIQAGILDVYDAVEKNSEHVNSVVQMSKNIEANLELIKQSFAGTLDVAARLYKVVEDESYIANNISGMIDTAETLVHSSNKNVDIVYHSVYLQKQSIENIARMSNKLNQASQDLTALSDSQESVVLNKNMQNKINSISDSVFRLIKNELCDKNEILSGETQVHQKLLELFKQKNGIIEAVWTNGTNGRFFASIPEAGIANASAREWFRESIHGRNYISQVYISAITKEPCITFSMPFYDQDGKIAGVAGVDLSLSKL